MLRLFDPLRKGLFCIRYQIQYDKRSCEMDRRTPSKNRETRRLGVRRERPLTAATILVLLLGGILLIEPVPADDGAWTGTTSITRSG